ncbi:response regulator transcription factor [Sphingobacterium sp. N143]|uniref:response regulator transcription factor n=1 Tax=Sphingobacterium sp. N143 TaxID=2746727 RepID=UPI0025790B3D|nr:response regulator transcription factor [Sphingobacterium sp. N143]MDM1295687.1 response regulator transcription factor [Sphingobacterium sp. N143]
MAQLLLIDDHALVRSGFRLILEAQKDLTVTAVAENGEEALTYLVGTTQPDLILTDIHMDVMDGLEFIQEVKLRYPTLKLIVLTMDGSIQTVQEALNIGVDGYLLKSSHVDEILFGIQQVLKGSNYISSALSIELVRQSASYIQPNFDRKEVMIKYDITERELSVLELIAEGYTNAEIADQIFLSKRTVEGHRQQLIMKTNTKNTAGLIRFGFQKKLLV